MTEAQWTTLLGVLLPFIVALTSLIVAETARVNRQEAQHKENAAKLDEIVTKIEDGR